MNKLSTITFYRWGRVFALSIPLLVSCAQTADAQAETSSSAVLVASNGGAKDVKKSEDVKEVILHVFGMT